LAATPQTSPRLLGVVRLDDHAWYILALPAPASSRGCSRYRGCVMLGLCASNSPCCSRSVP
jgi:hypothetical protein